jgi:hypothetical protein
MVTCQRRKDTRGNRLHPPMCAPDTRAAAPNANPNRWQTCGVPSVLTGDSGPCRTYDGEKDWGVGSNKSSPNEKRAFHPFSGILSLPIGLDSQISRSLTSFIHTPSMPVRLRLVTFAGRVLLTPCDMRCQHVLLTRSSGSRGSSSSTTSTTPPRRSASSSPPSMKNSSPSGRLAQRRRISKQLEAMSRCRVRWLVG